MTDGRLVQRGGELVLGWVFVFLNFYSDIWGDGSNNLDKKTSSVGDVFTAPATSLRGKFGDSYTAPHCRPRRSGRLSNFERLSLPRVKVVRQFDCKVLRDPEFSPRDSAVTCKSPSRVGESAFFRAVFSARLVGQHNDTREAMKKQILIQPQIGMTSTTIHLR